MNIVVLMPLIYATTTLYFNLTVNLSIDDQNNDSVIISSIAGYAVILMLYISKLLWGMKCA